MEHAQKTQRDAESGQHGLFGVFEQEEDSMLTDTTSRHSRLG